MNAIELLTADHEKVKGLFEQVRATEDQGEKWGLFKKIRDELNTHTHIEEKIFYPTVREKKEIEDIVKEGIQEHRQVDMFIREIEALVDDSDVFEPKLTVLMEDVEHHADEEEEEMFPKVRENFSASELDELGARLEKEKRSFKKSQAATA